MARCLVIGGAGFIGSHLVESLVARGHAVRVLDNFSTGNASNLASVMEDIELFVGDLADVELLSQAVEGVDRIFHKASACECAWGIADPQELLHASTTNTRNLLVAALRAGVRRVVYASSASVYGAALRRVEEGHPTKPLSPSAVAQLAGEEECRQFTRSYGLETVRLRYFNVFGPRQSNYACSEVIRQAIRAMLFGRHPVVNGDGLTSHDFIYVDDVVHANLLAAEARRVAGKVYNIGRGRPATALDVIAILNSLLDTALQPLHADIRPRRDLQNLADTSRSETELGFCPATDLETGLRLCVDSYAQWRDDLLAPKAARQPLSIG